MGLACALAAVGSVSAQSSVRVSNLAEAESGAQPVNQLNGAPLTSVSFAQSFTTGATGVYLDSITLKMADNNPDLTGSYGSGFTMTLHEEDVGEGGSEPGELLAQLQGAGSPLLAGTYAYAASEPIILAANTTYFWMAWLQPDGLGLDSQFNISMTGSTTESSDLGWSLNEDAMIYEGSEAGGDWSAIGGSALFSVSATAIPEPATTGVIAGMLFLGVAVLRRRTHVRGRLV